MVLNISSSPAYRLVSLYKQDCKSHIVELAESLLKDCPNAIAHDVERSETAPL